VRLAHDVRIDVVMKIEHDDVVGATELVGQFSGGDMHGSLEGFPGYPEDALPGK